MKNRLIVLVALAFLLALPSAASASTQTLLGDQSVAPTRDGKNPGVAKAFQYKATSSGTTTDLEVYTGGGTTATKLIVGLYSDVSGKPGKLLTSGSISSPRTGGWNDVPVGATTLDKGTSYWIATLGTGGGLVLADTSGGSLSYVNSTKQLTALPATYSTAGQFTAGPVSAYVNGNVANNGVLLGDQAVAPNPDANGAGVAQAFAYTAGASGTASDIDLYVNSGTTATQVMLGLYSDAGGKPGALLSSGSTSSVQAQAWNDVNIGPVSVTGGSTYWIALLGTGGQLNYPDTAGGAASSYVNSTMGLTSLPSSYSAGTEYNVSPASAYIEGALAGPVAAPSNMAAPAVSGPTVQGQTLTTSNGSWSGSPGTYAYRWQDCDSAGGNCSNISGATASSYTLQGADTSHTLRSVVSATNAGGTTSAASDQTASVTTSTPSAPTNTAAPAISGTTQAGSTLSATTGSWSNSPTSYAYQWQACDGSGNSCANIGGATGSQYTLAAGDANHTMRVVVAASNAGGSGSATSGATGVVASSGGGGGGSQVFVSQSGGGTGSGVDCNDAKPVSFFNSSANWGSGAGRIGPGVSVNLCGTISSALSIQGSGASGNPVTVYWEPGASMSSPDWGGRAAITTNGNGYITLNGGNNGTSIQATAEGTGLADQGVASQGIIATNCTGCTIENLTIANLYVHSSPSDTSVDQSQDNAIRFSGSNMTIANNTMHDMGWALYELANATDSNIRIDGNDIYHIDHGWASTAAFSGGNIGPIMFYGNHVHDFSNWDTTSDAYHHDGIHCYSANAQGLTPHYNGVYIYANRFDGGNGGANMTADIFLEGGSGSGSTPCSDNTSSFYIFNNVFMGSGTIYNGLVGLENNHMIIQEYNNTLVGSGTSSGVCQYDPASSVTTENNVMSTCNTLIQKNTGSSFTAGSPDYDVYANGGSNSYVCNGNYYPSASFNSWKTCSGGDTAGSYVNSASLNGDGSPQSGSPVVGAGANLTSLCSGNLAALCTNINGTPRPTTGRWNAGAY